MRIGIDIRHLTDPQPAGVGGYTRQLLEALFCLDQTNEYVLFASGSRRALRRLPAFNAPNVQVVTVPIPNKIVNVLLLTKLVTIETLVARRGTVAPPIQSVDVWFFPNHNFIHTKLPYAIMVHDLSYEIFPEFFTLKSRLRHFLSRRLIKHAKAVLCPSTSTKRDLVQVYQIDEEKIHVTPLAVKSEIRNLKSETNSKFEKIKPKRFILSLATLEPRKNQISVIEAYEAYRDQTHDAIQLVIGGGGGWKFQALRKAARRSTYASDISLIGYVSEEQKVELYQHAQAFLFPSFYEGFGLPVLEAMSAGCPVITSHTSSLPELVGDAGLLIDPYNVNDLTQALKLVLSSNRLRSDLIAKGKRRAEDFSWQETAKNTQEILRSIA